MLQYDEFSFYFFCPAFVCCINLKTERKDSLKPTFGIPILNGFIMFITFQVSNSYVSHLSCHRHCCWKFQSLNHAGTIADSGEHKRGHCYQLSFIFPWIIWHADTSATASVPRLWCKFCNCQTFWAPLYTCLRFLCLWFLYNLRIYLPISLNFFIYLYG